MKLVSAIAILVLAALLESTVLVVAVSGAVAGVTALAYAFYRTETLRYSIDRQRRELDRVKRRIDELHPPLPPG